MEETTNTLITLPVLPCPETDPSWRLWAKCKGMDPNHFFPERGQLVAPIKMVCYGCPVRKRCAKFAVDNDIPYGVFGGLTEKERRLVRRGERSLDLPLMSILKTCYHNINRMPVKHTDRGWMTKDVVKLASEVTGIKERVIRDNLNNAEHYFI